jgi:hypothetical protein
MGRRYWSDAIVYKQVNERVRSSPHETTRRTGSIADNSADSNPTIVVLPSTIIASQLSTGKLMKGGACYGLHLCA